jgi:hypothetical protein
MRFSIVMLGILILVLSPALSVSAQDVEWSRMYRAGDDSTQRPCAQQTDDGGYVIVATSNPDDSDTGRDVRLIKTDAMGFVEWDKIFARPGSQSGESVQQTVDGGYIIASSVIPLGGGGSDIWLIKTDSGGNLEWEKTFGGPGAQFGSCVQQTADEGYIILGTKDSEDTLWLVKTDVEGNREWDSTFDKAGWYPDPGTGNCLQQTNDEGYIFAGRLWTAEGQYSDAWLVKVDAFGDLEWEKALGKEGWSGEGESVCQTSDGGYIVGGSIYEIGVFSPSAWLIKTDASGNVEWDRTFGETMGSYGNSVRQTPDGGYALAGETSISRPREFDVRLIKTDANGDMEWDRIFGGLEYNYGKSLQLTEDGGYIIAGQTELIKDPGSPGMDLLLIKAFAPRQLTRIILQEPANESIITSPPDFAWAADGGGSSRYSVDIIRLNGSRGYLSWRDFDIPIPWTSWRMPNWIWRMIPSGTYVLWRVRGRDIDAATPPTIYSDEIRWFYKP